MPRCPSPSRSNLPRVFAAVRIPAEAQAAARAAVTPIWPSPGRMDHVTLRFWGEVEDIEPVVALCSAVAARFPPPEVTLRGGGAFPSPKRPRVLWLGVEGALDAVAAALGNEDFVGHLTVGRPRQRRAVREAEALAALGEVARFSAVELVLFRSDPGGRAGAIHTPVGACSFGG